MKGKTMEWKTIDFKPATDQRLLWSAEPNGDGAMKTQPVVGWLVQENPAGDRRVIAGGLKRGEVVPAADDAVIFGHDIAMRCVSCNQVANPVHVEGDQARCGRCAA